MDSEKKTVPSEETSAKEGEGFTMKDTENKGQSDSVDFPTFVFSLATGAWIHMGVAPDPISGKTEKNIELARQNIDLLLMIREKTKGNLTEDEQKMLEGLITETQLKFVEVSGKR